MRVIGALDFIGTAVGKLAPACIVTASFLIAVHSHAASPAFTEHGAATASKQAAANQPPLSTMPSGKNLPGQPINGLLWSELSPLQRQALAPLQHEWDKLSPIRKKKWLEIANKYAKMETGEQQRMQVRMRDWSKLSPEQRRIARESFARAKKLDNDQKSAKWQQYQLLPDAEKRKLAADAKMNKNVANLPRALGSRNQSAKPAAPVAVIPSSPARQAENPVAPSPLPAEAPQTEAAGNRPSYLIN